MPFFLLCPCGIENRAHRGDRATVFSDDFTKVLLRHAEFNDDRIFSLNPGDLHLVWPVHNRFRNVFDQCYHSFGVTSPSYISWLIIPVTLSQRPRAFACSSPIPV